MDLQEDLERLIKRRDELEELRSALDARARKLSPVVRMMSDLIKATEALLQQINALGDLKGLEGLEDFMNDSRAFLAQAVSVLLLPVASVPEIPEPEQVGEATLPSGQKPGRPKSEVHEKFGIWTTAATILRVAFAGREYPATLEEALERAFPGEWKEKVFSTYVKGSRKTLTIGEDLSRGEDSDVRKRIAEAGSRMVRIRGGKVPGGAQVPRTMEVLYTEIKFPEKGDEIIAAMKSWGLPVEDS